MSRISSMMRSVFSLPTRAPLLSRNSQPRSSHSLRSSELVTAMTLPSGSAPASMIILAMSFGTQSMMRSNIFDV